MTLLGIAKELKMEIAEGAYLYWDWDNVVFINDVSMTLPTISSFGQEAFPNFTTKEYLNNVLEYAKEHPLFKYRLNQANS